MNKQIKVSVFMLTYNQENYIKQAIEGVLNQKTNFDYELIIGEDASTDDTLEICKTYRSKYPNQMRILENEENSGLIANYMRTAKELKGEYIAICDGDDFWVDEQKLQKQVDFLDANNSFDIVYGKCKRLYPDGTVKEPHIVYSNAVKNGDFSNLIMQNYIPSVTVLFRNKLPQEGLPSWINSLPYGDWPTYLWTIKEGGRIHFINEVFAVYRVKIGESFKLNKKMSDSFKVELKILNSIANDKQYNYWKKFIKNSIKNKNESLMLAYNREGYYIKAFKQYGKLLRIKSVLPLTKLYSYSICKKMKLS